VRSAKAQRWPRGYVKAFVLHGDQAYEEAAAVDGHEALHPGSVRSRIRAERLIAGMSTIVPEGEEP
jgi:hypothetical protein